jgi:glycosyltransferase involved in cell wall biosynthesis
MVNTLNPALTVIIPVLNGMPYLPEMLASLEAQTFRDFTILLWDNGSTDGTAEEAQQWIPSRLPGRVVSSDPLPLHECLARMVEESATEYCARMDADDICFPDRFRIQMGFMREHPDIDLVGTQIECIDAAGTKLPKEEWAKYPLFHDEIVSRLMILCPFNHPSILFRRKAILQAGNYSVPSPVEDLNLYLHLVRQSRVANLSETGLQYRIHPQSICAVAKVDNHHETLARESLVRVASSVFGISGDVFERLRRKEYAPSIIPMLKVAWHLSNHHLPHLQNMITSPVFLYSALCMTSSDDCFSKCIYKILKMSKS